MATASIEWNEPGKEFRADPGATLALDRDAWEQLGARFAPIDDGQGETANLATAVVPTVQGSVVVGILDYGERTTYLLVPGTEPERRATTAVVLKTLADCGAIRCGEHLLDVIRPRLVEDSLEERVAALEQRLDRISAGLAAASSPAVSRPSQVGLRHALSEEFSWWKLFAQQEQAISAHEVTEALTTELVATDPGDDEPGSSERATRAASHE